MASDYPASIDAFPDPLVNSPLNSPSHAALHQDVNDAVEKIETKVGVGVSPASGASDGQVLMADGAGGTAWESVTNSKIDTVGVPAQRVLAADGAGGASWVSNETGLVFLKSQTLTSVGTGGFLITDLFSSDYRNYRAVINIDTSSQNLGVFGRFDSIATPYNYATLGLTAGNVVDNVSQVGGSAFLIGYIRSGQNFHSFTMDIFNPNMALTTTATYSGFSDNAAGNSAGHRSGSCLFNNATPVTGLTLLTSAGTVNGNIRVYGYRN